MRDARIRPKCMTESMTSAIVGAPNAGRGKPGSGLSIEPSLECIGLIRLANGSFEAL